MTLRALRPRWELLWFAFVLQVQGYPRSDPLMILAAKREVFHSTPTNGTSASTNDHEMQSNAGTLSSGKIIFPTDESRDFIKANVPKCEGFTFCENITQYPKNMIQEAIRKNSTLKCLANIDQIDNSAADITQRIDATDETPLCASVERVVYPQSAENIRKEWMFILNQNDFKQGVRVEICINESEKCSVIDGFSESYQTMCKQKYIFRELLAVGDGGNVVTESFRFPASCCCHLKSSRN